MFKTKSLFFSFLSVAGLAFGMSHADLVDQSTRVSFPEEVSFDYQGKKYQLEATGVATRKKLFIKVYSVASYIEDPSKLKGADLFANIIDSNAAKELLIIWVRSVDQKRVQDGYRESLSKVIPAGTLKEETEKYIGFFSNVNHKDEHVIRWLPDGTVVVLINGQEKGSIKNEAFAKDLLSVWFGPNSVVNKSDLITKIK